MTDSNSSLLPQHCSESETTLVLSTLPPFYDDGPVWYYLIWCWRLLIFSITGSTSLRLCRLLLQHVFRLDVATLSWVTYLFLVTCLELCFVYPCTLLFIGTVLGQRRYFGRLIYKGWGRLLPLSIKRKWEQSFWL